MPNAPGLHIDAYDKRATNILKCPYLSFNLTNDALLCSLYCGM